MAPSREMAKADSRFLAILDTALADSARRSGPWLACRAGCAQCCVGAFAINQLDAQRLARGLAELEITDSARAESVRARARAYVLRNAPLFPGDAATGRLGEDDEAQQRFDDFANEEPCPALDPATQTCDLYAARPLTCRVFGPPVRTEGDGLGVCELCFRGATPAEIAHAELVPDPDNLEAALNRDAEALAGAGGSTVVAWALLRPAVRPGT